MSRVGSRYIICETADDVRSGMYIASLPRSACKSSVLNVGTDDSDAEVEVVVKFTAQYNSDAHQLLAEAGLAPTLHACQLLHGGLYMVVMDYLKCDTLWARHEQAVPRTVYEDVKLAVEKLHDKDFVFGDLRLSNVMCVRKAGRMGAMLVDFDWVEKDERGKYNSTMNDVLPDWAKGMMRGAVMKKEHDLEMLEKLNRACRWESI